ncbi:DUF6065 family protein [Azospirillum sp. SYSU D00513]|uniref:DUF6065 family protein n=1 Tax=Azospirillum sp. SYSU D00513 TaxID=2812561 RepID=UPI001FFFC72B|nr:DUF6065 family protein [Azospirillum sp. SYSU D00513]
MLGGMKIIAYPLSGVVPDIRPASSSRDWIDALPEQYGYRCLPLNIASMHGWEIGAPCRVRAVWNGGAALDAIRVVADEAHPLLPASHFGSGVLTFHVGALFRTPPGVNLMVTGPLNHVKDGIQPLAGIMETDWSPYPFTMNWKFTAPGKEVTWEKGEPFAMLMPIQRGLLDSLEPEVRDLDSDPELAAQYRGWAEARTKFNKDLQTPGSDAMTQRWQKGYYRGMRPDGEPGHPDHQTKVRARPFKITPKA